MSAVKFIDFFAGIGGIRIGMEQAGHECVGFCEFDKFAVASYTSMHLITDEQRAYLATLPLKYRQKEILKDEYRNGEWYCKDIRTAGADELPRSDCWCFGAPCQDFSFAGTRQGLEGDRSSLIREIFRLLGETPEEKRPEWLLYENVKGMLSSNRGLDFLFILCEMDFLGYDIEWQLLDSRLHGVPQHRERVYTIGHLRRRGSAKVFPIKGTNGEDCLEINQIGHLDKPDRNNPSAYRVYDPDGISPTINTSGGGGREVMIGQLASISEPGFNQRNAVHLPEGISRTLIGSGGDGGFHSGNQPKVGIRVIATTNPKRHSNEDIHHEDGIMSTITRRDCKSPKKVGIPLGVIHPNGHASKACDPQDVVPTLTSEHHSHQPEVVLPCLTPDRANKRQNGRRFKDSGEEMFTLTAQDIHGVAFGVDDLYSNRDARFFKEESPTLRANCSGLKVGIGVDVSETDHPGMYVELEGEVTAYAVWYEKEQCYIVVRKLTPKEYFRLQGFPDLMFERAQFVNSDSQLYRQGGNSVTVNIIYEIAKKMKGEI